MLHNLVVTEVNNAFLRLDDVFHVLEVFGLFAYWQQVHDIPKTNVF
jgi:hypothetical protein